MKVSGKSHKYGDNVDTDVIIPARYLNTPNAKELAAHCMEDIDASFATTVKPGEIMVAGKNFGWQFTRARAARNQDLWSRLRDRVHFRAHLLPQCLEHRAADSRVPRGRPGHPGGGCRVG